MCSVLKQYTLSYTQSSRALLYVLLQLACLGAVRLLAHSGGLQVVGRLSAAAIAI